MPAKKFKHKEIIETLQKGNFFIECSTCAEEVQLRNVNLFDNDDFSEEALEIYELQLEYIREKKAQLKSIRDIGTTKSEVGAHSTNFGFIMERIAPTMPSFRFKHNDCRSLFDPIDYVIFEGLTTKGAVDKIFFVDIKTGNAKLSKKQKEIKGAINAKNVEFKKF